MEQKTLDSLIEASKKHQKLHGAHGFEHTERVVRQCMSIGEIMSADLDILVPAAVLHDLGRGNDEHAEKSAEMASMILKVHSFTPIQVAKICDAIRVHSFSAGGNAISLEAKILSDVDKLDAVGAIGICRAAMHSGEHLRPFGDYVNHFYEKLLKLKDLMHTEEVRKLADKRSQFMIKYLEQLDAELKGEL